MIYTYQDIKHLHLEISSECNAECPRCPRNFYGYPLNQGFQEHSMTLAQAQTIFPSDFIRQLDEILINGNFGDIVMCAEAPDIVEYFRTCNPDVVISISTNGAARGVDFWRRLAAADCVVYFCIDGLEDTHSLYRRNTSYHTVIKNAQIFIQAGGRARWKFIVFDHNQHQLSQAQAISESMGFDTFAPVSRDRNRGPVFDKSKTMVFYMGSLAGGTVDFDHLLANSRKLRDISTFPLPEDHTISCQVQAQKSVYVNSIGEVFPCCWLGHNPSTYQQALPWSAINPQIANLVKENNALEHGLEHAIDWFHKVSDSWHKSDYESGLLYQCVKTCGQLA